MQGKWLKSLVVTGAVIGIGAVLLTAAGNPANMGICVACFIRDIAGAVGLDSAVVVQYIRPEVLGFILGAFVIAVGTGEFRPSGGSSPLIRFTISFFVMIGALVFLGCPLRMVLRLAGGDLNALVGLAGFAVGIVPGALFLKKGFSLGRAQSQPTASGYIMPAVAALLLVFVIVAPSFIKFSETGPGSMRAPIAIALGVGLVVGILAQRSRMCMAGGIRDIFLIKNGTLFLGYATVFVVVLVLNLVLGKFSLGFAGQPIAHTDSLWNFLGMALVGFGSILIGGCPLRQVVLAGEGNADGAICVAGLLLGAATAHNFGLASSGAGPTTNGMLAVVIGFVVLFVIAGMTVMKRSKA